MCVCVCVCAANVGVSFFIIFPSPKYMRPPCMGRDNMLSFPYIGLYKIISKLLTGEMI